MKNSKIYFAFCLIVTTTFIQAQTEFSLDALGRGIFSNNTLGGNLVSQDSTSDKRGVSGYALFDLGTNLKYKDLLRANAILRVKSPFGAAFGQPSVFQFRQFQIIGKINKNINYEFGDINVELTPYTVHNAAETFHTYESDIFKDRRNIVEYENFISGNVWRLQGVHSKAKFDFESGIKSIKVYAFGTRTNATDNKSVPDRLLAGARLGLVQSDKLEVGLNYTGLLDVAVSKTLQTYKNRVLTGDIKFTLDQEAFALIAKYEGGISNYNFEKNSAKIDTTFKDYFYDGNVTLAVKSAKIKLNGGYKEVGPQFYSPAAQTTRLDPSLASGLFSNVGTTQRTQNIYDRTTQEGLYNRVINPVFYNFDPIFGNISPYGAATPNRRGFSVGVSTDTSVKALTANIGYLAQAELIGEGTTEKRKFSSITGGATINISKLLSIKNTFKASIGYRNETTTRGGIATVDFKTSHLDLGVSGEIIEKFEILGGIKMINAKGNEWLGQRNEVNQLSGFQNYIYDVKQNVYAVGARLRFAEKSYLMINYNFTDLGFAATKQNYNIKQLFLNYTIIL